MAQTGIHGIVGMAVRKWMPGRVWLILGIVLGSILPEASGTGIGSIAYKLAVRKRRAACLLFGAL
jgi:hypothetical protein